MKNKMKAITLLEVIVVIGIIGIVIVIFLGVVKPKLTQTGDIKKTRATIYTVQKMLDILFANERISGKWTLNNDVPKVCSQLADLINTKGEIGCEKSTSDKGSFVMANGVSITGLENNWKNPSENIKHKYRNVVIHLNNRKNDTYNIRIFKDEPVLVLLTPELLNTTNIAKFRVVQLKKEQNNAHIKTYEVVESTKKGVTFGKAACLTGVADEFMSSTEKASITGCTRDTGACSRYFDCGIEIMDIPSSLVFFAGNR